MTATTDDLRIQKTNELISPEQLITDVSVSDRAAETVAHARRTIHNILSGEDDRLLVIVGPCSIHDPDAAREYAAKLRQAVDAIAECNLLVPWQLPYKLEENDEAKQMTQVFKIDAIKLQNLGAEELLKLNQCGGLMIAYAQLLSEKRAENFAKLIEIRNIEQTKANEEGLTVNFDALGLN